MGRLAVVARGAGLGALLTAVLALVKELAFPSSWQFGPLMAVGAGFFGAIYGAVAAATARPGIAINLAVGLVVLHAALYEGGLGLETVMRLVVAAVVATVVVVDARRSQGRPMPPPSAGQRVWRIALAVSCLALVVGLAWSLSWIGRESHTVRGVEAVAFPPDGGRLLVGMETCVYRPGTFMAMGSLASAVRLWNVAAMRYETGLPSVIDSMDALAVSPDGATLALSGRSEGDRYVIELFDLASSTSTVTAPVHGGYIWSLAFSPDGTTLASAGDDGKVVLWSLPGGRVAAAMPVSDDVRSVAFSPDGKLLAWGARDGSIGLWSVAAGELQTSLHHDDGVATLAFSPGSSILASAGWDGVVRLWDATTGEPTGRLEGHSGAVRALVFSPDGRRLVSGSDDTTARIWDVGSRRTSRVLRGHANSVAWAPDGTTIAMATPTPRVFGNRDARVRLYGADDGRLLQLIPEPTQRTSDWIYFASGLGVWLVAAWVGFRR